VLISNSRVTKVEEVDAVHRAAGVFKVVDVAEVMVMGKEDEAMEAVEVAEVDIVNGDKRGSHIRITLR
jgi:hypothetical protein